MTLTAISWRRCGRRSEVRPLARAKSMEWPFEGCGLGDEVGNGLLHAADNSVGRCALLYDRRGARGTGAISGDLAEMGGHDPGQRGYSPVHRDAVGTVGICCDGRGGALADADPGNQPVHIRGRKGEAVWRRDGRTGGRSGVGLADSVAPSAIGCCGGVDMPRARSGCSAAVEVGGALVRLHRPDCLQ